MPYRYWLLKSHVRTHYHFQVTFCWDYSWVVAETPRRYQHFVEFIEPQCFRDCSLRACIILQPIYCREWEGHHR